MLTKSATSTKSSKKKNIKAARTKLKASYLESKDVNKPGSTIAKDVIEQAYYRKVLSETLLHDTVLAIIQVGQSGDLAGSISKTNTSIDRLYAVKILLYLLVWLLDDLLQEVGLVAGEFDPGALFEMELGVVQSATQDLYKSLKILVVERVQPQDLNYQTGSSHYASATSEPDSDSPRAPQHMSLGPSGAKYLRSRVNRSDQRPAGPSQRTPNSARSQEDEPRILPNGENGFLKEQSLVTVQQPPPLRTQDIDMGSVGTPDSHSGEYDPDDLGIPSSSGHTSDRATIVSAATGPGGPSLL
ncbi:hypothetical protein PHMEG_00039117 [Phytophthora megakarya]|uniref:Uncharacterized protein n=1 Tax=Phytophthora megakarya TaxID=4795 RepID=A0A225UIU0_9STRA|nr:hypothetical protein PHMEG_00039117 [Phytophthora megakarya]